ncbi:MAG TPA: dolichyl-phosphate beta-glucosyltransferase [Candidatus Limnocylindrales bacterium]|nr:dolichyl-phosphate beta-glucosyltransferase [Candidatus Limnocylindrales bacterium]
MTPDLSIVIPAYNEAQRLPATLDKIERYLGEHRLDAEVLVVDDGSQDGTAAIVRERAGRWGALRLVSADRNRGKGAAVRLGMAAAHGRFRVFTDADLSVPIDDLERVLGPLRNGTGVAIASRALPDSDVQLHQSWHRELMGKVFNRIVRIFVLGGIGDTQCGFKGFTAEAAERVFAPLQTDGFGFDVEVLYRARQAGYKIAEVPTRWVNSPQTKVRPLLGLKAFLEVMAIPGRVRKHPS